MERKSFPSNSPHKLKLINDTKDKEYMYKKNYKGDSIVDFGLWTL